MLDTIRKISARLLPEAVKRPLRRFLPPEPTLTDRILAAFAAQYPSAVFCVVGANDGLGHDPLRPHVLANRRWTGVLIEPLPDAFGRLRQTYKSRPFRFINAAIGKRGSQPFYYLDPAVLEAAPIARDWYSFIASFDRNHLVRHGQMAGSDFEPFIRSIEVQSMPLGEALAGLNHLDLLMIDAEGYDWLILQQIDFAKWHPAVVVYEHSNLNAADTAAAAALLTAKGYLLHRDGINTLALKPHMNFAP